jgi:hypothetical protein
MKDKIFVHIGPHLGLMQANSISVCAPGEQEYIRKDALIEWAKVRKKAIEVNGNEKDAYTRGMYSILNSLIDKLNTL